MSEGYFATTNTKIAACLLSVGVPLRRQDPVSRVVQRGRETVHYWFSPDGVNGFSTNSIVNDILRVFEFIPNVKICLEDPTWVDPAWIEFCKEFDEKYPELTAMCVVLYNREMLLDVIFHKTRRLVMVNLPGGAVMLADEKLDAKTKRDVAQMVM